jgi:putative DNA primase/helicase
MRQDFFEFFPQFKLFVAGNHKPAIRNIDEAMNAAAPDPVHDHRAARTPRQADQQKLLAERDGILAWAVQGCSTGSARGSIRRSPWDATEEYFEAEDALGRWLDERCVREANAKSLTAELFNDWKQWAEAAGEFIGSQKRFADLLLTRGFEKWRNGMGVRGFQGIGLKHPPTPAYTPTPMTEPLTTSLTDLTDYVVTPTRACARLMESFDRTVVRSVRPAKNKD